MKKVLIFLFLLITLNFSYSKQLLKPNYVYDEKKILLDAQIYFDNNDYSNALKTIIEAKQYRKNKINWEVTTLENSFKPAEVKYAGNNISDILPILEERQDYDAIEIINRYLKIKGLNFFNDSSKNLLDYIKSIIEFPEADFLIGNVYKIEGEYNIAKDYYIKAYKNANLLDIPSEKYSILYSLAQICNLQEDYDDYEKYLLLIVSNDKYYKDKTLLSSMEKTIKEVNTNVIEKFFKLYRANNFYLLNAYMALAEYYELKDEKQKSLQAISLCSLTGFTKILDIVSKRNPEFVYKDLNSLFLETTKYNDIIEWGIDNNVWKSFYKFANIAEKNSYPIFAKQLYTILYESSPEEYWKNASQTRLKELSVM